MICKRCGSKLVRKRTNKISKKAVKRLGIPFGGTYICRRCYPIRK